MALLNHLYATLFILCHAEVTHLSRLAISLHKRPSNVKAGHCHVTRAIARLQVERVYWLDNYIDCSPVSFDVSVTPM